MWLLEESVLRKIEHAISVGFSPSAEEQGEYVARLSDSSASNGSRILTVEGNTAKIRIDGVLTKSPDFLAFLFGGGNTTYSEVIAAISAAEADNNVKSTEYFFDTAPGGSVNGLFDALAAMQLAKKPSKAIVSNVAASAAFAMASQTGEIVALNRAARVGSIGVAVEMSVSKNSVQISSTEAPKKRPDVTTEEGQAIVREELDAVHQLFAESIATGRDTTVDKVNSDFGQGATLLADEALKRGMIDNVAAPKLKTVGSAKQNLNLSTDDNETEASMDLTTLMTQHPDVYKEAVSKGVSQERDRVCAHLIMGEKSGAMKTASEAIQKGEDMTATLQATYMTAGMNRSDVAARQGDDGEASGAEGAAGSAEGAEGAVASLVEERLGVNGE